MGSNPPIKAIPPSVAQPDKHIATFLASIQPFSLQHASSGVDYFSRSRRNGDELLEEDWRLDHDEAASSRQRRRLQTISGQLSIEQMKKRESCGKSPIQAGRRSRQAPYQRRSPMDTTFQNIHATYASHGRMGKAIEPRERESMEDALNLRGLHRVPSKKLPPLPITPPSPELVDSERELVREHRKHASDRAKAEAQTLGRLTIPRGGFLSRGVSSQPVKVAPSYERSPGYLSPADANTRHLSMYTPQSSPYSGYAQARSLSWSPWAASAQMQQSPFASRPQHEAPAHWIDEIGSLYGLGGDDRAYSSYYDSHDIMDQYRSPHHPSPSTHLSPHFVEHRSASSHLSPHLSPRHLEHRSASTHLSPHLFDPEMIPEGMPVELEVTSMEFGSRSPYRTSYESSMPPPAIHIPGYHSWPSTDPMTPISPSEEVITFDFTPKSSSLEAYHYPSKKREPEPSLPPLNTLSLQSPALPSYYNSPHDFHHRQELQASMY